MAAPGRDMSSHPLQRLVDASPRQFAQGERLTQLRVAPARQGPGGLPSQLRAGIETLSGMDMGDVVVHRNSAKPAQLSALAYAQGNQIHLGPGQEKHLPHEAWHVVQQRQGRVMPTAQMKGGVPINDDRSLEREADVMGARALQMHRNASAFRQPSGPVENNAGMNASAAIQRYAIGSGANRTVTVTGNSKSKSFQECTYNWVEYKSGDKIASTGTATTSPAAWATWLVNQGNGNNATQLHVVNRRWGGLGGTGDGNIVPGTPAENSHHLHGGESEFDMACFGTTHPGSSATAQQNAKYECMVTPSYGTAVDVKAGAVNVADPTMVVRITTSAGHVDYPIAPGGGMKFKEGN
jgi:hypothetical protein